MKLVQRAALLTLAGALSLLLGCRNPFVQVTVRNTGKTELHNIEVDYPSASFGISSLAPGAAYSYRIQLRDAGRMKVEFFDQAEQPHSGVGPYAAEGQQGTLLLLLDGSGKNTWTSNLHPAKAAPAGD